MDRQYYGILREELSNRSKLFPIEVNFRDMRKTFKPRRHVGDDDDIAKKLRENSRGENAICSPGEGAEEPPLEDSCRERVISDCHFSRKGTRCGLTVQA